MVRKTLITLATIVVVVAIGMLGFVLYFMAETIDNLWYKIGAVESTISINNFALKEAGYIDTGTTQIDEKWIKRLLSSVSSANISIEYNNRGYQTGTISIYFEKDKPCSLCDKIYMWLSSENATEMTIIVNKD